MGKIYLNDRNFALIIKGLIMSLFYLIVGQALKIIIFYL